MRLVKEDGTISPEMMTLIENTKDLLFIKNRDFVYIACSRSFALDCVRCNSIKEVIGKTDYELFHDKSVADRYRKDDIELFNSKKPMLEFKEDYLDGNGNKHLCLTTKYLFHDKNGEPIALFGQYHDISKSIEESIVHRRDINRNVAAALGSTFFVAYYADLINHSFETLNETDYSREMLKNCTNLEKAIELFINNLVKPEFQDKIREFCNTSTIPERVKIRERIDCEYLSVAATGWCRASFFPTEWDENGNVTHVLFAVCKIDTAAEKELNEGIANKQELETIFNEIPGGIVLYKWDGKNLKVLKMSKYYKDTYGYSMLNNNGFPNFNSIHPDDLENYQKACFYALTVTHTLDYIYRVWNREKNCYSWAQINAISHPQADGTSLVYAMYSDITTQKNAELNIAKKQASLAAALKVSNQLSYEYDPVAHTGECLTDDNFFNLPKHINNYPESLREFNLFHPDDIDKFIKTAHEIDKGQAQSRCDVRIKKDENYHWYSCVFNSYFDAEKERNVAILTVLDITFRMEVIQNYKERLHTLQLATKNALCMCDVNVTKNTFSNIHAESIIKECGEKANSLNEFMQLASQGVYDLDEKKEYLSLFNQQYLLSQFKKGKRHISFEHFYRVSPTYTEYVETSFDLIPDLITGDIVGICSAKSLNEKKMSRFLLDASLDKDYPLAALVYSDTGEYYLYEAGRNEYCQHKHDYWKDVFLRLADSSDKSELENVRKNISKKAVMNHLATHDYYVYTFYGTYHGAKCRLEAKFRYVDIKHSLLLATLRNITDTVLYQKYKYESEHDPLTNLCNRKTVFQRSRELLEAHPDEQFVMLHCDVSHFHLYNTFFGEKAGDELLCRIADTIRYLAMEYDYITFGRIESDVFCMFFPVDRGLFEPQILHCFQELESFSPNFPLRLAIGAYWVTDPSMSMEAMFSRATIAAKSGKKNLFNLISRYDESMDQNLKDTHQITSEMTTALSQEQFKVYLQPKYSLRSKKLVGAEALVRWQHPDKGMISPAKFIPIFEQNGFIAELDRYMWEHVCQILSSWQYSEKPMYPISVNVSRVSMYSHATIPFLKALVKKYNLDPKYLELELTETAYIDDPEDLKAMLQELQDYGFKILMDDFGSGYSSLNTLRELPVDVLKLDIKFLSLSKNDLRGNAVLSSVIRMSKLLNLPIVAEGVENQEQADYLESIGCEYVQGFLFARPMPVSDYEKLLNDGETISNNISSQNQTTTPYILRDLPTSDPLVSVGVLEYKQNQFAYLHTNKRFLTEFGLIENLNPASKVFRAHLDDKNHEILLKAFAYCSEKKKEVMFRLEWNEPDNSKRLYDGHLFYNGQIGSYADLSVVFVNITNVHRIGFDK